MPEQTIIFSWRPADLDAQCWRIQDKSVAGAAQSGRVQGVGRRALMMSTVWPVRRGDQYRLTLTTPDGFIQDIYCVATEVSEEAGFWSTLRILSLPDGAEERLAEL